MWEEAKADTERVGISKKKDIYEEIEEYMRDMEVGRKDNTMRKLYLEMGWPYDLNRFLGNPEEKEEEAKAEAEKREEAKEEEAKAEAEKVEEEEAEEEEAKAEAEKKEEAEEEEAEAEEREKVGKGGRGKGEGRAKGAYLSIGKSIFLNFLCSILWIKSTFIFLI